MRKSLLIVLLLAALVMAACGGGQPAATGGGNVESGKALYVKSGVGPSKLASCTSCHSVEKGRTLVGPSMFGAAASAAARIKEADYKGSAKTAEEYLKESIVSPDAYVAKGFNKGIMPTGYAEAFSQQELGDLIAYISSIK